MTGENIFRELGGLDHELILKGAPKENKKPNTIKKLTLIAACLTLILFVTATLSPIIAELINGGTHGEGTVGHTTPYYADFEISIVENGQIRKKTVNLPMDFNTIFNEWLKANDLDDRYTSIGMRIIVERFELPKPEPPAEFSYVYDNTYIFYFSTDINEFLNKEENRPYLEALTETLDYADKIISDFVEAYRKTMIQ